jgi:8-oxo-dGTP pyrophosphatase MutT (NUDIX family)
LEEAVVRELKEETGISIDINIKPFLFFETTSGAIPPNNGHLIVYFYVNIDSLSNQINLYL